MGINYDRYLNVCRNAIKDDKVFNNFKSNPDYTWVLEHVSSAQGQDYLDVIRRDCPELLNVMHEFAINDNIGNPARHYYESIGMSLSPTTLRYVKVLSDLIKYFGSLDGVDIVEVGGGYGGQCKVIYDLFEPRSYTLVDLPEVLFLAEKYLNKHDINPILKAPQEQHDKQYGLFISNYALTELDRATQELYVNNIIKNSHRGYMTCNFVDMGDKLTKKEILSLHEGEEVAEEPLTSPNNFIYIWNHIRK